MRACTPDRICATDNLLEFHISEPPMRRIIGHCVSTVAFSSVSVSTRRPCGLGFWPERTLALAGLVILSPLLVLISCAIRVLAGGPPLVAHLRVGRYGSPLWIYKFRTMWTRKHVRWIEYVVEEPNDLKDAFDPRVSHRFARLLRRYSIDELPQLWNVARGEMAFIGPRPLTRSELETHYGAAASEVLSVRPGLSGLWQVCGRSRLSYAERRSLDIVLVRDMSVRLYLWILARTVVHVARGGDAW